jgi:hypothetical protein
VEKCTRAQDSSSWGNWAFLSCLCLQTAPCIVRVDRRLEYSLCPACVQDYLAYLSPSPMVLPMHPERHLPQVKRLPNGSKFYEEIELTDLQKKRNRGNPANNAEQQRRLASSTRAVVGRSPSSSPEPAFEDLTGAGTSANIGSVAHSQALVVCSHQDAKPRGRSPQRLAGPHHLRRRNALRRRRSGRVPVTHRLRRRLAVRRLRAPRAPSPPEFKLLVTPAAGDSNTTPPSPLDANLLNISYTPRDHTRTITKSPVLTAAKIVRAAQTPLPSFPTSTPVAEPTPLSPICLCPPPLPQTPDAEIEFKSHKAALRSGHRIPPHAYGELPRPGSSKRRRSVVGLVLHGKPGRFDAAEQRPAPRSAPPFPTRVSRGFEEVAARPVCFCREMGKEVCGCPAIGGQLFWM